MNKSCANCYLFSPINEKEGQCSFWLKIIPSNDYCVEYKKKIDQIPPNSKLEL